MSKTVPKTNYLKVDNKSIEVSVLPKNIRDMVDTLDDYNQRRLDVLRELEMIEYAIVGVKQNVNNMLVTLQQLADLPEIKE